MDNLMYIVLNSDSSLYVFVRKVSKSDFGKGARLFEAAEQTPLWAISLWCGNGYEDTNYIIEVKEWE